MHGEQFYDRFAEKPTFPYLVRITDTHLNIRKGPSVKYASRGYIKPGTYTIVDEKDGFGLLKAYAEPKRDGWVMLKYTERKKANAIRQKTVALSSICLIASTRPPQRRLTVC